MLGWIIIFAALSLFGISLCQSQEVQTASVGYGFSALFGVLFMLSLVVRTISRHSS